MTSSYRPPTFQSSARPVDTFVRQSTVPLIEDDGFTQLTKALSVVNPVLDMYMDRSIEEEKAEGIDIAIEQSFEGFKDTSKEIGKTKGQNAARQLIGGSIFADRAYQKTKTQILANNLETNLTTSYQTTQIDGKSLSEFSVDSQEYQNWLAGEREKVVEQLGDVKSIYVAEHFLPKLASATERVSSHHIQEFKKIKVENIKSLAIPLVENLIVSPDVVDEKLILDFETTINNLGLPAKDRSDINKTLVKVITASAEAVGFSDDGNIEAAEDILAIAEKFPYGPSGTLNLTSHPDYQSKVNKLKKSINDYVFTQERRRQLRKEREKNDDIVNTIKTFAGTGDASLITNLQKKYPLEASKIGTAGVALDGNTRERSAQLESTIIGGGYASKKDAANAALAWYLDERTPKTQANRTRLSQLLTVANGSENGDYTEVNKGLAELNSQLKGEFSGSDFIISDTGQLNDLGSKEVTDLYNAAKLELYRFILSPEGREADTLTVIEKVEQIKTKYIQQAREKANPFKTQTNEDNSTPNSQNLDDIEGDASSNLEAGFFSDDDSPTTVTVQQGDTLTQLADSFSTTVNAIKEANNLTNEDLIQIGQELIMPISEAIAPTITASSKQQAIVSAANELGVRPQDLASVISQETMGTFNHQITGGEGGNYKGLIQFGIPERKKYGYREDMTFEEQMLGPVVRYLKDRGVKPGHGVKEIYAAILTGNVSTLQSDGLTRTDSFGTSVESALPELGQGGSHYNNALDFLAEQGKFKQKS